MYRFLLTPRWLAGLAVTVVVAVVCVLLGMWQWDRREQARERNEPVLANYDREPRPLTEVLPDVLPPGGAELPRPARWTPVTTDGEYLAEDTVLVRNRSLNGRPGYVVLVPFAVDDGPVVVVDRGWVPIGATGSAPDDVPAPPQGPVTLTARLQTPEPHLERDAPAGQLHSIHPPDVAGLTGLDVLPGVYLVAAGEDPAPAQAPARAGRPAVDEGPHLSYALQWFVFATGAFVGYGVLARREAADRRAAGVGGERPAAVPAAPPSRSRRRSDEDVEDEILDAHSRG